MKYSHVKKLMFSEAIYAFHKFICIMHVFLVLIALILCQSLLLNRIATQMPRLPDNKWCGLLEGWDPVNSFNQTPTDRPESVCNRCVIEVFVAFLCCHFIIYFLVVYGLLL